MDDKESDESMTRASPAPTLLDPGWLIPGFPKTANLNHCYRSRPYSAGRLGLIAAYGAFPSDGSDRALGRRFRTVKFDAVLIFLAACCVRVQPHGSAYRVLARNATARRHQLWRRDPEPALLPSHWSWRRLRMSATMRRVRPRAIGHTYSRPPPTNADVSLSMTSKIVQLVHVTVW